MTSSGGLRVNESSELGQPSSVVFSLDSALTEDGDASQWAPRYPLALSAAQKAEQQVYRIQQHRFLRAWCQVYRAQVAFKKWLLRRYFRKMINFKAVFHDPHIYAREEEALLESSRKALFPSTPSPPSSSSSASQARRTLHPPSGSNLSKISIGPTSSQGKSHPTTRFPHPIASSSQRGRPLSSSSSSSLTSTPAAKSRRPSASRLVQKYPTPQDLRRSIHGLTIQPTSLPPPPTLLHTKILVPARGRRDEEPEEEELSSLGSGSPVSGHRRPLPHRCTPASAAVFHPIAAVALPAPSLQPPLVVSQEEPFPHNVYLQLSNEWQVAESTVVARDPPTSSVSSSPSSPTPPSSSQPSHSQGHPSRSLGYLTSQRGHQLLHVLSRLQLMGKSPPPADSSRRSPRPTSSQSVERDASTVGGPSEERREEREATRKRAEETVRKTRERSSPPPLLTRKDGERQDPSFGQASRPQRKVLPGQDPPPLPSLSPLSPREPSLTTRMPSMEIVSRDRLEDALCTVRERREDGRAGQDVFSPSASPSPPPPPPPPTLSSSPLDESVQAVSSSPLPRLRHVWKVWRRRTRASQRETQGYLQAARHARSYQTKRFWYQWRRSVEARRQRREVSRGPSTRPSVYRVLSTCLESIDSTSPTSLTLDSRPWSTVHFLGRYLSRWRRWAATMFHIREVQSRATAHAASQCLLRAWKRWNGYHQHVQLLQSSQRLPSLPSPPPPEWERYEVETREEGVDEQAREAEAKQEADVESAECSPSTAAAPTVEDKIAALAIQARALVQQRQRRPHPPVLPAPLSISVETPSHRPKPPPPPSPPPRPPPLSPSLEEQRLEAVYAQYDTVQPILQSANWATAVLSSPAAKVLEETCPTTPPRLSPSSAPPNSPPVVGSALTSPLDYEDYDARTSPRRNSFFLTALQGLDDFGEDDEEGDKAASSEREIRQEEARSGTQHHGVRVTVAVENPVRDGIVLVAACDLMDLSTSPSLAACVSGQPIECDLLISSISSVHSAHLDDKDDLCGEESEDISFCVSSTSSPLYTDHFSDDDDDDEVEDEETEGREGRKGKRVISSPLSPERLDYWSTIVYSLHVLHQFFLVCKAGCYARSRAKRCGIQALMRHAMQCSIGMEVECIATVHYERQQQRRCVARWHRRVVQRAHSMIVPVEVEEALPPRPRTPPPRSRSPPRPRYY